VTRLEAGAVLLLAVGAILLLLALLEQRRPRDDRHAAPAADPPEPDGPAAEPEHEPEVAAYLSAAANA
jgi:cell division septation protein DedD